MMGTLRAKNTSLVQCFLMADSRVAAIPEAGSRAHRVPKISHWLNSFSPLCVGPRGHFEVWKARALAGKNASPCSTPFRSHFVTRPRDQQTSTSRAEKISLVELFRAWDAIISRDYTRLDDASVQVFFVLPCAVGRRDRRPWTIGWSAELRTCPPEMFDPLRSDVQVPTCWRSTHVDYFRIAERLRPEPGRVTSAATPF